MKTHLNLKLYLCALLVVISSGLLFLLAAGKVTMHSFSSQAPMPNDLDFAKKPWSNDHCQAERTHLKGTVASFAWICDEDALDKDAEEVEITKMFKIRSGSMARRANFWKRIYLTFNSHEYVLHSSEYPEVIIEFATPAAASVKPRAVRKALNDRRMYYRRITRQMQSRSPAKWSKEQQRLAKAMAHIKDRQKFKKLSKSLRIQRGQKDFLSQGLKTSKTYLPHIKKYFTKAGVPEEIAYIAFVESSFNLNAESKVGASGVYQIMPFVGRKYLTMDPEHGIDERNDPIKAGRVAAQLFKENYNLTKSWPLAITGYNHGAYGMKRIKEKLGTSDIMEIIKRNRSKSFGFAGENFYIQFLTIADIMSNEDDYYPEFEDKPLVYKNHTLKRSRKLNWVEKNFKTSRNSLKKLNPDLSNRTFRRQKLPKGYQVKVSEVE